MWNWPNRLAAFANISLCAVAAFYIGKHALTPDSQEWHYSDLIVIILTALGVVMAALGVGIAIMAIWG